MDRRIIRMTQDLLDRGTWDKDVYTYINRTFAKNIEVMQANASDPKIRNANLNSMNPIVRACSRMQESVDVSMCMDIEKESNSTTKSEDISINKQELYGPRGIMLYSVPSRGSAQSVVNAKNDTSEQHERFDAVHAVVASDNIVQCLPWHFMSNPRKGDFGDLCSHLNSTHLSIELAEPNTIMRDDSGVIRLKYWLDDDKTKAVILDTYDAAVQLCAHLCKQFCLNPSGKIDITIPGMIGVISVPTILSHREAYSLGEKYCAAGKDNVRWCKIKPTLCPLRYPPSSVIPRSGMESHGDYGNCLASRTSASDDIWESIHVGYEGSYHILTTGLTMDQFRADVEKRMEMDHAEFFFIADKCKWDNEVSPGNRLPARYEYPFEYIEKNINAGMTINADDFPLDLYEIALGKPLSAPSYSDRMDGRVPMTFPQHRPGYRSAYNNLYVAAVAAYNATKNEDNSCVKNEKKLCVKLDKERKTYNVFLHREENSSVPKSPSFGITLLNYPSRVIFDSHIILHPATLEVQHRIESSDSLNYKLIILADITNESSIDIEGIEIELNLPPTIVAAIKEGISVKVDCIDTSPRGEGDTPEKFAAKYYHRITTAAPKEQVRVVWTITFSLPQDFTSINDEYIVTIKAKNTLETSQYGSIFFAGHEPGSFCWPEDTWSFENFDVEKWMLKPEDLHAFLYESNPHTENKSEMESLKASMEDLIASKGCCYGMSVVAILAKTKRIKPEEIQQGATNLHMIERDEAESLIAYYQLSQVYPLQGAIPKTRIVDELNRIAEMATRAGKGGPPFRVSISIKKGNKYTGHAVVAYDIKHGVFDQYKEKYGVIYDTCIFLYDPNHPFDAKKYKSTNGINRDAFLYFNRGTETWTIPYLREASYTYLIYIRGSDDINKMDSNSWKTNTKNMYARLRVIENTNLLIGYASFINTIPQLMQNEVEGATGCPIYSAGSTGAITIMFENGEQPFTIWPSSAGAPVDLSILYANYYIVAKATANADAVHFNSDGFVSITGEAENFCIAVTADDEYHDLPWHTVKAHGRRGKNLSLSRCDNGFLLAGIRSDIVTLTGSNDDETKSFSFKSDGDILFIGESEGELAAYFDADGDGIYERLVAKSSEISPLPTSLTLFRKEGCDVFSTADMDSITWQSTNDKVLKINDKGEIEYPFARIGRARIQAVDHATGAILAETDVTIKWRWWQWILVALCFGWGYL